MFNSKLGQINWKDIVDSFFYAFISSLVMGMYNAMQNNVLPTNWAGIKPLLIAAFVVGTGKIVHAYFTNSDGDLLTPEPIIGLPLSNTITPPARPLN